ncbi:hypothetical protein STEG23_001845 [Scotinomys teguina]
MTGKGGIGTYEAEGHQPTMEEEIHLKDCAANTVMLNGLHLRGIRLNLEVPPPLMFPMTVTPLGRDQDCALRTESRMCRLSWFLDPGGWGKAAAVGLYFIFPGICTLSLPFAGQTVSKQTFLSSDSTNLPIHSSVVFLEP